MDRVRRIFPLLVGIAKVRKIRRKGVPVKEDGVVWVNGADGSVDFVVEPDDSSMLRVGGLVQRVVTCNPLVVFVVPRKLCPKPEDTVLEVFVVPN